MLHQSASIPGYPPAAFFVGIEFMVILFIYSLDAAAAAAIHWRLQQRAHQLYGPQSQKD
jgi:hypothetical protein